MSAPRSGPQEHASLQTGLPTTERRRGHSEGAMAGDDEAVYDAYLSSREVIHARAVFEILEKCPDRHARAFEQPCAADLARHTFNRRTLTVARSWRASTNPPISHHLG